MLLVRCGAFYAIRAHRPSRRASRWLAARRFWCKPVLKELLGEYRSNFRFHPDCARLKADDSKLGREQPLSECLSRRRECPQWPGAAGQRIATCFG